MQAAYDAVVTAQWLSLELGGMCNIKGVSVALVFFSLGVARLQTMRYY